MFIEKYQENKADFEKIINYILQKQPNILSATDISFSNFENKLWCKVSYVTQNQTESHFWANDTKVFSKDKNLDIKQLNKDYAKQIYLNNIENASSYIAKYETELSSPSPRFLFGYQTIASSGLDKKYYAFFGVMPQSLFNKAVYLKYISNNGKITDDERCFFLLDNQKLVQNILLNLANEYQIECTPLDAENQIQRILLTSKQKQLNNSIQEIIKHTNSHNRSSFENAKKLIFLEQQIENLNMVVQQKESIYRSCNKLNSSSLKYKIKNHSIENCQLLGNDFYRTILETIFILEKIEQDTQNFKTKPEFTKYWKSQLKQVKNYLKDEDLNYNYDYDLYSTASIMSNHLKSNIQQTKNKFYSELLEEKQRIFNDTPKDQTQLENYIDLNYMILAEEIKKTDCPNCQKIKLYAETYTKYHNLTEQQIQAQYKNEIEQLSTQIEATKAMKARKIAECKNSVIDIKDILKQKSRIDEKLDALPKISCFNGLEEIIQSDFENADAKQISQQILQSNNEKLKIEHEKQREL